jgi:hypothetical protein
MRVSLFHSPSLSLCDYLLYRKIKRGRGEGEGVLAGGGKRERERERERMWC